MPVNFEKKVRKMRGSVNHGYGSKKKHRGKGSQGGKGWGGSTKHKRSFIYAYKPDHFGHKGFHSIGREEEKVANVGELEKLGNGKKEISLADLGYGKLLGDGKISVQVTVHVAKFSKSAKEKIESAGGKIISASAES